MKTKLLSLLIISTLVLTVGCGARDSKKAKNHGEVAESETQQDSDEDDISETHSDAFEELGNHEETDDNLDSPVELYFISQYDSEGNLNFEKSADCPWEYELTSNIVDIQNNGSVIVTGADIEEAEACIETNSATGAQEDVVQILFTKEGTKKFAAATTAAAENRESIAIYYRGAIISCPIVQSAITDGLCVITGLDSFEEAESLAKRINQQ